MNALVLVAHGTRDPRGAETVRALAAAVAEALPSVEVSLTYVDVQEPLVGEVLDDVVAKAGSGGGVVVVPLLLSRGYHVDVDIADAAARHPGVRVTKPLGPDAALATLVTDRLQAAGVPAGAHVVLAAAGSSRTEAAEDVTAMGELLASVWSGPVTVAYAAGSPPSVPDAVASARVAGAESVVVASYLLAEGFFHDRLADAGADLVTSPLAAGEGLAQVVGVVTSRCQDSVL
ncbi:sirohydrochlorin ferrochelatase [Knoellia remsis]|uniref:Sirohydrochlorin ferrochelatase n=1 Tax=Knoellia remsis TaxID=407159 RepID=A0A2T0UGH2_9MICO|nr:CbiX/SirB N-terminal domain-containing protein [Knoellia remsis]PRY57039.1 sirohydrochlorin ferrochelatase [Knoellia remsis]